MNNMLNSDIRSAIKKHNLRQYQVAEKIGVSEFTFVRWLRRELSDERRAKVMKAIEELRCNNE